MPIILEICANSISSALAAQEGGADRIELCDNMADGGTTPSYGTIKEARRQLDIQVYPIIRPRGGDFLYNEAEFESMIQDILICKELGCDGVVIGLLNADGTVDATRSKRLIEAAQPMGITYHRAFDRCRDPFQALETIIELGCERILTSGQEPTAPEGTTLIAELIDKAAERIIIMPGSGVRVNNIACLVRETGAKEFHSTAKTTLQSKMEFKNPLVLQNEKEELITTVSDATIVRKLREEAENPLRD